MEFFVSDSFVLSDEKTVITIDGYTDIQVAKGVKIQIVYGDSVLYVGHAYKEFLLKKFGEPEIEAFVIKEKRLSIPSGSKLRLF